eukprot:7391178-Prymnesium_polylepis.1
MGRLARHGHAKQGWCVFADAMEPRQSAKVLWFRVLPWWEGRATRSCSWHSWGRVRTRGGASDSDATEAFADSDLRMAVPLVLQKFLPNKRYSTVSIEL